jgi:hypothetical protein
MRKSFSALVVAVLVAGSSPAQGQNVGVGVTLSSEAGASWLLRTVGDVAVFRFLHAGLYEDPSGGRDAIAVIGTSHCSVREDGRIVVASCRVVSRIAFLRPRDVSFDPFLESAEIEVKDGRTTHRARWRYMQGHNPDPNYSLNGGERVHVASVSASRPALARGRVANQTFSPQSPHATAHLRRAAGVVIIHEIGQQMDRTFRVSARSRRAVLNRVSRAIAGH